MNKTEWFRAVFFKEMSDSRGGVRSTKETKESWTTIYGSFGKTYMKRTAGAFSAYSPSFPSALHCVKQLGPPHTLLTGQPYSLIYNQSSFEKTKNKKKTTCWCSRHSWMITTTPSFSSLLTSFFNFSSVLCHHHPTSFCLHLASFQREILISSLP